MLRTLVMAIGSAVLTLPLLILGGVVVLALMFCSGVCVTFLLAGLLAVLFWLGGDASALFKAIQHLATATAAFTVIVVFFAVVSEISAPKRRGAARLAALSAKDLRSLGRAMQRGARDRDAPFME